MCKNKTGTPACSTSFLITARDRSSQKQHFFFCGRGVASLSVIVSAHATFSFAVARMLSPLECGNHLDQIRDTLVQHSSVDLPHRDLVPDISDILPHRCFQFPNLCRQLLEHRIGSGSSLFSLVRTAARSRCARIVHRRCQDGSNVHLSLGRKKPPA